MESPVAIHNLLTYFRISNYAWIERNSRYSVMNYSEALTFSFRDEKWVKKLAIGGAIAFISLFSGVLFFLIFLIIGYYLGVIRNVITGEERALPSWSDFNRILADGILGGMIGLIYLILIGGLCTIAIVNIAADASMAEAERACAIVFVCTLGCIGLMVFINFGLLQFAVSENFGAAFNLTRFFGLLRNHLAEFLTITIFSTILNLTLLCVGFGIFSPFTNFWGMVVQAHLFGQYAQMAKSTPQAIQPV